MLKKYKIKITFIGLIITISIFGANYSNKTNHSTKEIPKINSEEYYKVVKVLDGDTFDILIDNNKIRVRMLGIDTPEIKDKRKTVQCFAKNASEKTKELILNNEVRLLTDISQGILDKYNRVLAYVYTEDGILINSYLISNGYAHEYTYRITYEKQIEFKKLETEARINKQGLWGDICNT